MTERLRKLQIIEEIATIDENDAIIVQMEELLRQRRIKAYEDKLKPMTAEELTKEIEESELDIESGRVMDIEDFATEADNW